jgi:chromosomal replication initiator protein
MTISTETNSANLELADVERDQWARFKGRLRTTVGEDVYTSWFARMDLDRIHDDCIYMTVPTKFLKSWIQAHYADRVLTCWQSEDSGIKRIDISVRTALRTAAPVKDTKAPQDDRRADSGASRPAPELRNTATAPVSASHDALGGSPLDPRLTFATFVMGRSNTLAHAAARQVAEGRRGDSVMFNPLYIHAGVGLGKTHLLQAVTWAGNSNPERKVLYLTAEKFMYGFVAALKSQTALAFKEALRGIDVLVIDDLQFLQGKSTQSEFCHTLNALIDAGRQVVIAADRPPSDLESLDDRVRSRLAGGLVVEMGSLGEELRLEILKSRVSAAKAHHATFDVPAPVLEYLAKTITHNGRDLEGAINRLLAHSKLNATTVTLEMAEREVRDLVRPHGAEAGQDRGYPARGCPAVQCEPFRSPVIAPDRQCGSSAPGGDVSRQDADAALTAGNRTPFRRPRPHHGSSCRPQDRDAGLQGRHTVGRGRASEASASGVEPERLFSGNCRRFQGTRAPDRSLALELPSHSRHLTDPVGHGEILVCPVRAGPIAAVRCPAARQSNQAYGLGIGRKCHEGYRRARTTP